MVLLEKVATIGDGIAKSLYRQGRGSAPEAAAGQSELYVRSTGRMVGLLSPFPAILAHIESERGQAMKSIFLFVCLVCSSTAFADPNPRREQLASALARVQQEQQSLYQQFQMSQELRRIELQDTSPTITQSYPAIGMAGASTLNFDENQRIQREKNDRLRAYERQLAVSYSRFIELESRKQELLQQIVELDQSSPPAAPANTIPAPPSPANASRPSYGNTDGRR